MHDAVEVAVLHPRDDLLEDRPSLVRIKASLRNDVVEQFPTRHVFLHRSICRAHIDNTVNTHTVNTHTGGGTGGGAVGYDKCPCCLFRSAFVLSPLGWTFDFADSKLARAVDANSNNKRAQIRDVHIN